MVDSKNISISPIVSSALNNFTLTVKKRMPYSFKDRPVDDGADEFKNSGSDPLPTSERLNAAVTKFNGGNELKIVAMTNYCAEVDNDFKLLQEYKAFKNPSLNGLEFTPSSADTVLASYKRRPLEIKCGELDDGSNQYEINFDDGSKISYISFSNGGKMKINGEEFEMPAGTIYEERSIHGKVFSQLIQTPGMKRNIVNMPECVNEAEQTLRAHNS